MKCEYCELRRVGPFVISKACAMLSGKLINKQTGEPLKICMHHMASPDPCMNNGNGCGLYKSQKGDQANERRTAEQLKHVLVHSAGFFRGTGSRVSF